MLSDQGTYILRVTLDDGSEHHAKFPCTLDKDGLPNMTSTSRAAMLETLEAAFDSFGDQSVKAIEFVTERLYFL